MTEPFSVRGLFSESPVFITLTLLNLATVLLISAFATYSMHKSAGYPAAALTLAEVRTVREAIAVQHENQVLLQQLIVLITQQIGWNEQLPPLLRKATDAMDAVAAQVRAARADQERMFELSKKR